MVFILDWNSKFKIPSPISSITTPEFLNTALDFLILSKIINDSWPGFLVADFDGIS